MSNNAFNGNNDVSKYYNQMGGIDTYEALVPFIEDKKGIEYSVFLKELKTSKVADIGSGYGLFQNYLSKIKNGDVTCVDPVYSKKDTKAIERTKNEFKNRLDRTISADGILASIPDEILTDENKNLKSEIRGKKNGYEININNLENWEKKEGFDYKDKLEKEDEVDIAFSNNVFALIPEGFLFLEEIMEKLNDKGKYYLIDHNDTNEYKNVAFIKRLIDEEIIDGEYNDRSIISEFTKEDFETKKDEIKDIYDNFFYTEKENIPHKKINEFIISSDDFKNGKLPDGLNIKFKEEIIHNKEKILGSDAFKSGRIEFRYSTEMGLNYQDVD